MKPDWKDAPEWAQWLAQDDDGEWYWYEMEPLKNGRNFYALHGRIEFATTGRPPEMPKEPRP